MFILQIKIFDPMNTNDKSKFPLVVIVGSGFGGLEVARRLEDQPVEVLMLDKHNYHTFQPLLYQVALGSLESESIAFSLRKNFGGQKNLRFRLAEVTKINPEKIHHRNHRRRDSLRLPGDSYRINYQFFWQ